MNKYKCGHKPGPVIITSNSFGIITYYDWVESTGFDGDNSECWQCYIRKLNK